MDELSPEPGSDAVSRKPRRIQLSRAKGWRKPPGVVVVSRPSFWSNCYRIGDRATSTREEVVALFRWLINQNFPQWAVEAKARIGELTGKDLACWCPVFKCPCGQWDMDDDEIGFRRPETVCPICGAIVKRTACHADVLLEMANAENKAMSDPFACTDCGVDTRALREEAYQVRPSVWELAYPGYRQGVGVGASRPCIGCLQGRLGRPLSRADFTKGSINDPDPARHSSRLMTVLADAPAS